MKKYGPLIASVLGAVALFIQQKMAAGVTDLKVVLFGALIIAVGVASMWLKGKQGTLVGIIGTVGYTFYTLWQSGTFTWNEFILTSIVAIITLIAPSLIPVKDETT